MYSKPEAKIILDSVSPRGDRVTTMELKIHRFVLAELNTHRAFSRNSASSRAIPFSKQLERLKDDPAVPVEWGINRAGMQATEVVNDPQEILALQRDWLDARDVAMDMARRFHDAGIHKQITNRIIEPYMWHHVIVTGTSDGWANFFHQRCSEFAQPEMREAAYRALEAYRASVPQYVTWNDWHLPLIQRDELEMDIEQLKKISIARCARVSYLNHNGVRDLDDDIRLYNRIRTGGHWSPFEHVCSPAFYGEHSANLTGWITVRASMPNEFVKHYRMSIAA